MHTSGAVVVADPKFCGKTTTCMLYQKSFVKLNTQQAINMARMNLKAVQMEGSLFDCTMSATALCQSSPPHIAKFYQSGN